MSSAARLLRSRFKTPQSGKLYCSVRRRMATRLKLFLFISLFCLLTATSAQQSNKDQAQIRGSMEFLAGDAMRGRASGSHDELLAATYLASQLREIGNAPAGDDGGYIQNVSGEFNFYREGRKQWHTRNVIGVLRGRDEELKDQVILLTAHMDHVGLGEPVNGDSIYNGADDDASGCV